MNTLPQFTSSFPNLKFGSFSSAYGVVQQPILSSWDEWSSWLSQHSHYAHSISTVTATEQPIHSFYRLHFGATLTLLNKLKSKFAFTEELFTDMFYETSNFDLMKNDNWLKKRDDVWIFTMCKEVHQQNESRILKIEQTFHQQAINEHIKEFTTLENLDNLPPFASIPTNRFIFNTENDSIKLTVDCALLDEECYSLCGALTFQLDQIDTNLTNLIRFLQEGGVPYVPGKIIEYIKIRSDLKSPTFSKLYSIPKIASKCSKEMSFPHHIATPVGTCWPDPREFEEDYE